MSCSLAYVWAIITSDTAEISTKNCSIIAVAIPLLLYSGKTARLSCGVLPSNSLVQIAPTIVPSTRAYSPKSLGVKP